MRLNEWVAFSKAIGKGGYQMSTSTQVMELFNIFSKTFGKEEAQIIVKDIEEIIDSRKQDLATRGDILDVKGNILDVKKEIKEVELRLTKEIEQIRSSTIKWVVGWMVGLIIAQTAAITTFMLLK